MRRLFLIVAVYLPLAHAAPFRFEPRLEMPVNTQEYDTNSCITGIADTSMFGQAIAAIVKASPQSACFLSKETSSEAVSRYFEDGLAGLGYSKASENDQAPELYSSKWATSANSVISLVWLEYSPSEVLTFAFYNDGSLTREGAVKAAATGLAGLLEQDRQTPDYQTPALVQESRVSLVGALELPLEFCESGLPEATLVGLPLVGCYHVPQTLTQTFLQLEEALVSLGYGESFHAEEPHLILSSWRVARSSTPQVGLAVVAAQEPVGGALLFEVDTAALQTALVAANQQNVTETWADGLGQEFGASRQNTNLQLSVGQDTYISLPPGALKLPLTTCKEALTQTTYIEAPLLGCYHLAQTFTQAYRHFGNELAALGYVAGYLDEAFRFTAATWSEEGVDLGVGAVFAYTNALGGSLLFTLDPAE